MAFPDDLRASLSPGTAVIGDTLALDITSPTDVKGLEVRIIEVDSETEEETKGRDVTTVTFKGDVVNSTFTLSPAGKGKPNPKIHPKPGKNAPKITVEIGGVQHSIPLPGRGAENGVFELQLSLEAPGHQPWRSSATIYVRDFQFYKAKGQARPVITFIMDRDPPKTSNPFMTGATRFWKNHADAVIVRPGKGIEEINTFLRTRQSKFGMWGEINIVCHGHIVPLTLRLFNDDGEKFLDGHKINEAFASNSAKLAVLGVAGLDKDSRIVFRACEAGNNNQLLNALHSNVFNSTAPVFIPKNLQGYISDGSDEFLGELFPFFHPSKTSPSTAVIEAEMRKQFSAKYPGASFATEKSSFERRDDLQHLNRFVKLREEKLFKNLGSANPTEKTGKELVSELQADWTNNNLDQDDRYWFTKPTDWEVAVDKKTQVGVDQQAYWLEVSVAGKATANPKKKLITSTQTITFGSAPSNTVEINAQGVAASHATVQLRSFGSKSDPFDLLLKVVGSEKVSVVKPKRMELKQPGHYQATGNLVFKIGKATVTIRFVKQIELEFGLRRRFIHWRRKLREFDSSNPSQPYRHRPVVKPVLTNPSHYGTAP